MNSTIRVKRRESFSVIPDRILEDKRMRTETRLILGWLIARPDGWQIRVWYVQKVLGLTAHRWARARSEMQQYGYLSQRRITGTDGKFYWEIEVTDTPLDPAVTIPKNFGDGEAIDGKSGDKSRSINHHESNRSDSDPLRISQTCFDQAKGKFEGWDILWLEQRWQSWTSERGTTIRNPDRAFLVWAEKFTSHNPI